MALVTIGIPVYNEERFLEQTIESAISQTFPDLEILIADNASTDKSAAIIDRYHRIDSRIRPIYHKKNGGLRGNYDSLLDNATGKYFVFLGAHDLFLPEYIAEAAAFLESNPDFAMAYPRSHFIDAEGSVTGNSDSDIDTSGLGTRQRMIKVAEDLSWCTCIHGVFRTDVLRKIPRLEIQGGDQYILFAAAYYGQIRFLEGLGILRREWRGETSEMIEKRRIQAGMYAETGSRFYDGYSVMAMEHLVFIMNNTTLPLWEKLFLTLRLLPIFRRSHHTTVSSIALAFLNRGKGRGDSRGGNASCVPSSSSF